MTEFGPRSEIEGAEDELVSMPNVPVEYPRQREMTFPVLDASGAWADKTVYVFETPTIGESGVLTMLRRNFPPPNPEK